MWPIYKDDGNGKNIAIDGREATVEMQEKNLFRNFHLPTPYTKLFLSV